MKIFKNLTIGEKVLLAIVAIVVLSVIFFNVQTMYDWNFIKHYLDPNP